MTRPHIDEGSAGEPDLPRERRMTLGGHLRELRRRLVFAVIGLAAGMIVAAFLTDWIIGWLTYPIEAVASEIGDESFTRLTFTTVTGPFDMRLRISFVAGLVLSSPVWLWQLWRFVTPGLTRREFWYAFGFMAAAIPLFLGGVVLAMFLLPNIITIMASFFPDDVQQVGQIFTATEYYNFVFRTLTIIGVGFVTPVFLVALNLADVVRAKQIAKAWRWVLLLCLVFGMFASPPADMVTFFLVSAIMFVLYALAAGVCWVFDWSKKRRHPDLFVEYA
ncbi:twin-arginine translocase subunit TatC [Microbacterium excoecariae]|uniref:twin-arginine translocase subunit TatC n=1 Tax=Microbacterium excoecariae TaxID=2715210 RepID=UPI00140AF7DE|nr:twin-arginine translocase subunit TatC [Microbacterium excoecariae]